MKKKIFNYSILVIIVASLVSFGFRDVDKTKRLGKPTVNDNYNFIAINQVLMWISNNGDGSHDPITDGSGFYWPGGRNAIKPAIFEDGLVWGGKIGREIRFNGNTHRQGLQAGKILDVGIADDPSLSKYRVYKIRKGWELLPPGPERDAYEKDYKEWPIDDGAPYEVVSGEKVPKFIGDEVLWYVANDLDNSRSTFTYGSPSIGLEFQTTVFGFNRTGPLGDMVFKKYKIINKSGQTIKDLILGYWSDTDLGLADDDFTGCDTVLSLGYTYNGDNNDDGIYGAAPPAVGYDFFQGPIVSGEPTDSAKFLDGWRKGYKNLPMTAFTFYCQNCGQPLYRDPRQGNYEGTLEFYNYLSGYVWNGNPFIDPHTGQITKFVLAGDPVAKTGWYEGVGFPGGPTPGDRRHVMASGPFNMAPNDTQEVVVALVIARGTDNINSVAELKKKDKAAQIAYDLDFKLTPAPPNPTVHTVSQDRAVTLWWEPNAESYDAGDPLIYGYGYSDTTYTFEGYRIWQFRDLSGTDPKLLAVLDVQNGVSDVYDYVDYSGVNVYVPVIKGPNAGIFRYTTITQNAYTNAPLYNGTPYYFGITAYGYSAKSSPTFLESPPAVIEVIPETPKVDLTTPMKFGESSSATQIAGPGDGHVSFKVIDPIVLTGDKYKVVITGGMNNPKWTLINVTKNDTLLTNITDFGSDSLYGKIIVDGFIVKVQNIGIDSVGKLAGEASTKLKGVYEVATTSGTITPVNVLNNLNSTKKWKIVAYGTAKDMRDDINWQSGTKAIGWDDYELKFTGTSQYYTTGYAALSPIFKSDPKSKGALPFEAWNVGRNLTSSTDDVRLSMKVLDYDKKDTTIIRDSLWTRRTDGSWEPIYITTKPPYVEPLPNMSGSSGGKDFPLGNIVFVGEAPENGTVVRFVTWKPLAQGDEFEFTVPKTNKNDKVTAKNNLDKISVFPNPYFGANALEVDKYRRFVRFTNLPREVTARIYNLSGVFIRRIDKSSDSPWLDWDLRNQDGLPVASGIYIAYLEMPGIGQKILKIAVIMETQYIDRL